MMSVTLYLENMDGDARKAIEFRVVRWCTTHDSPFRWNNGTKDDPNHECWEYSEDGFQTTECKFVDKLVEV